MAVVHQGQGVCTPWSRNTEGAWCTALRETGTKDGVAQRDCDQALSETMQLMRTVSQRNDPKGDQKLNFVTLVQKYVLVFTPPHMLMAEVAQIPT